MSEFARILTKDDKIYDLLDVVDEGSEKLVSADTLDDETSELVSRVAERVARDMFPPIAEKIIREEINKLKERFGE